MKILNVKYTTIQKGSSIIPKFTCIPWWFKNSTVCYCIETIVYRPTTGTLPNSHTLMGKSISLAISTTLASIHSGSGLENIKYGCTRSV